MKHNGKISIVVISSGQPSANPRMVKEATALYKAGFDVTVIFCPLSPWADDFDKKLFEKHRHIKWRKAGYSPLQQPLLYKYSRLRGKLYGLLFRITGSVIFAERSFVLFSQELWRVGKKHKADLYIGHNLGALPVAVKLAGKTGAKVVFDFEDFHRGEDVYGSTHWKMVECIENKYVPMLDYAATASPLICDTYQKIFPDTKFITINNCFALAYAGDEITMLPGKPLKLFWFSQFIGEKRGLEAVIRAIGKTGLQDIQLSLLGNCDKNRKDYFSSLAKECGLVKGQLQFLSKVSEDRIASIAAQHHIGLASELPEILNRDLCLTNKIFIYLLAGNAVLFSDTKAQKRFLEENPDIGFCYSNDNFETLSNILVLYYNQPSLLKSHRQKSLQLAKEKMNWEKEKEVLLIAINKILK